MRTRGSGRAKNGRKKENKKGRMERKAKKTKRIRRKGRERRNIGVNASLDPRHHLSSVTIGLVMLALSFFKHFSRC